MRMNELSRHAALRALFLLGATALAAPVMAQTAAAEDAAEDDIIIVTASKQSRTLQDTPIAVSVASKAQIEVAMRVLLGAFPRLTFADAPPEFRGWEFPDPTLCRVAV